MRLTPRQWVATLTIVAACLIALPHIWKRFEPFPAGPDYRVPYALSKDYWLYQRRLEQVADARFIPVLGDSVVWGEYVRFDGTLPHFLNQQGGESDRFVNCGVNGLFPLALEGLVANYGATLHDRKVIVQCNPLWLSSPKADLSTDKEEKFNHSRLVPQFTVRIPCYRADASERISALLNRNLGYFAWVGHLQNAYYDQKSLPQWTLEGDGNDPPVYRNAWRSPLAPLRGGIPTEPANDAQRGPASARHRAWNAGGAEPVEFDWVSLDRSLQWQAFQRLIFLLRGRRNDVLVLLGPFNEHMIAADQRPAYRRMRDQMAAWFASNAISVIVPEPLPSSLYADASHPLTGGYALLAEQVYQEDVFRSWSARPARVAHKP
jgi:hypothetical protein